ncbi:MAG: hypothetical protein R3F05_14340 [Planctomycetota bacterium]
MSAPDLASRIQACLARLDDDERAGVSDVVVVDDPAPCRFEGEDGLAMEVLAEGDEPVLVVRGEALGEAPGDDEIEEAVVIALDRWHEDLVAAEALPDEKALFETHAAFRRGEPTPSGWYRRGEPIAPGVWIVDLDLFVELLVSPATFEAMAGQELTLYLDEEAVAFDAPAQPDPEEVWTLSEVGLFEPDPGQGEPETEEEEAALTGRTGDLHIVPVLLRAAEA